MNFSIIIPAHNEEEVIVATLNDLKRKVTGRYEIVVVDDCSTDQTSKVIKNYQKVTKNVRLVKTSEGKSGFAQALKKGFSVAKTEIIVPVMADMCDDAKTINHMYKKINEGWDIVCGSRYLKDGRKTGGPKIQGVMSTLVNKLLFWFGATSTDTSNAFKMYRKKFLKNINFSDGGVEASMEIYHQAVFFNKARSIDIPTNWVGRAIGISKFKIVKRAPRYLNIFLWTASNLVRQRLNLKLIPYLKSPKERHNDYFSPYEVNRNYIVWKILCQQVLEKHVSIDDVVIDIGAGRGGFINHIKAKTKIAIDQNKETKNCLNRDVKFINCTVKTIPSSLTNVADVIFMSNFLEHMDTKKDVLDVLNCSYKLLKKRGKLIIMQPNIDLLGSRYWDFFDHKVALNTKSLVEGLEMSNFQINKITKRFFPYTAMSGLPSLPLIIQIYLWLPSFVRPFAGQSLFIAVKR